MSCLNVSSSFPPMSRQIDIWAVSNLTFVLLSFTLLHSTTEVPFIVIAINSLQSGSLNRVSGDATRVCAGCAKMYLKHDMPSLAIKYVRSHTDILCNVILCVGCTICVASSTSTMIWCDHCLLGALWFRFHVHLAKCLLFGFRSSYLSAKCERHSHSENATRE